MTNYLIYVASGSEHVRLSYTERAYWSIPFGETRASPTRVNRTSNWVQSKQSYSPFQFRTPLIVCVMINQYEKSVHSAHTRIENTLRVGNGLFRLNSTADTHTHTHTYTNTHTHTEWNYNGSHLSQTVILYSEYMHHVYFLEISGSSKALYLYSLHSIWQTQFAVSCCSNCHINHHT